MLAKWPEEVALSKYLSTRAAQDRFGLSRATIWAACRAGQIEPQRLSARKTIWPRSGLERLANIAKQFERADAREAGNAQ